MAEALNGTFKAELIHRHTWRTRDQVEYAIVEWIGWYNHRRLHSAIGNIPPTEYEATYYRSTNTPAPTGASNPDFTKPGAAHFWNPTGRPGLRSMLPLT
jgi:putative transposase